LTVVWRGAGGGGVFSGHLDGQIRAWLPQLEGADDEADDGEHNQGAAEAKTKKRKALDDAFRTLMGRQVTFSQGRDSSGRHITKQQESRFMTFRSKS
jgi:DNA excision repair protein ERCC-8